eukprot:9471107-Pyramimonas_sp.AAC.1
MGGVLSAHQLSVQRLQAAPRLWLSGPQILDLRTPDSGFQDPRIWISGLQTPESVSTTPPELWLLLGT